MTITQPLMEKIRQLRATPEKEVSGLQLIRTFVEHRIQPLAARAHCMWDYTGRRDPTRFSSGELREAEINDGVRTITSLKKKSTVPKNYDIEAFSKSHPCTEVCTFCSLTGFF
jgi:TPP-dependent indolepyruvate ferredoxin oxidoreductase alpha subunit